MKTSRVHLTTLFLLLTIGSAPAADYHEWASTPPMGWNSWDCFGTSITEAQTKAQADVMAEKLKSHGWQYIVVDIQWYQPTATGHDYVKDAKLTMDEFSRLVPAPEKFPSAADGSGFKELAAYVHGKGLKFGIHMMRGIPRQAVRQNSALKGTSLHAPDIADTNSVCHWNTDMYGVDIKKPGAQAYYDSLMELVASWDVDFIKVDDLSRPYHQAEIEAIRKAIDKTGRPIVFSTSPGETPLAAGPNISHNANMWRISDDFWDNWRLLLAQFKRLNDWTPHRVQGAWPDADMLPLGIVRFTQKTHFTPQEQVTMISLWSIARSPLILGCDLTKLDDSTLALITNDEVLAVNQRTKNNRQLFRTDDGLVAWIADAASSSDKYVAFFNTRSTPPNTAPEAASVSVTFADAGLPNAVAVRDLWAKKDLGVSETDFTTEVPPHGARLFRFRRGR
jgi:alpha-galactosidase